MSRSIIGTTFIEHDNYDIMVGSPYWSERLERTAYESGREVDLSELGFYYRNCGPG